MLPYLPFLLRHPVPHPRFGEDVRGVFAIPQRQQVSAHHPRAAGVSRPSHPQQHFLVAATTFAFTARLAENWAWSSHCVFRSNLRLASVRDPNQGIQIPITVTSRIDVLVTPDTNCPDGIESILTSST